MDKFESHKLNSYSIKELLENPHINGIIYKVFNRYRRAIDLDELDSIKMTILWDCANRYDPSKGAQFTSFLYQQLTFACMNELKKRKNEFNNIENLEMLKNMGIKNTHKSANISDKSRDRSMHSGHEMYDMIDGLPPDIAKVLEQRFVYSMTMNEIGSANGYSRETARRRLINAIQVCKKRNSIKT